MNVNCHFCNVKCSSGKETNYNLYCNACFVFHYPETDSIAMATSLKNRRKIYVDYYYKLQLIWIYQAGYSAVQIKAVVNSSKELLHVVERVVKNKNYI